MTQNYLAYIYVELGLQFIYISPLYYVLISTFV